MMQSKNPNKFQPKSKQEGTYGKLLPRAIYPGMVNWHLSPYQTTRVAIWDAALLCWSALHLLSPFNFKPWHRLITGTPIHSQKQPASSPKPEIKVVSATTKSVNILIKWYTGLSKVNSTPSPGGSSFLLAAMQEKNWAPPCSLPVSAQLGLRTS